MRGPGIRLSDLPKERRLEALKARATDPSLLDVVRRFRPHVSDRRLRHGLDQLEEMAPKGARFSWLTVPKHLTELLGEAVAAGRAPNSVHRSLYAAIKALLRYEVGEAKKRAITADVQFRYLDDSRDVTLTPEQVRRLIDACDEQLRPLVQVAILTGIDRGPLLRVTAAHIDFAAGTVKVPDRKNKARARTLEVSAAALSVLARQASGRADDQPLFDLTPGAAQGRFYAARAGAGLPELRFKDLRHVFASTWVATGGSLKDLGGALGHTRASTSLRYTASQARAIRGRMDQVAEHLGLERDHLRVERGGGA